SFPPQELKEIPSTPREQEGSSPPPPRKIVKSIKLQPTPPLTFLIPCGEEEIAKISHQGQQEKEPSKEGMIKSLVSLALKYGIEKIPLLMKPIEEAGVEEQMVVRIDFVAVEEELKEEVDQQSIFSKCSVHVGTLFEGNVDPLQVAQSAIEEEDLAAPNCPLE
ncbi:hypothetical protein KI387_035564, partial [Taxus chinensis]